MSDKPVTTEEPKFWGASFAVKDDEIIKLFQEIQNTAYRNMVSNVIENIYSDNALFNRLRKDYVKPSWFKRKIIWRFIEVKNRISNAYDCLVKGVDPYDGF